MTISVVVVPREPAIAAMTMTTRGMVRVWLRGLARETMAYSVLRSPSRSGTMRASWGEKIKTYSPIHATHAVYNRAKHARFVFLGTNGPIKSRRGRMLAVGQSQYGRGSPLVVYRRQVDGQRANNVPMKAFREVKARRRL